MQAHGSVVLVDVASYSDNDAASSNPETDDRI